MLLSTRTRPGSAFGLLASVQFVLIAAITVLNVALPAIQRELHLTTGDLALASAAYGLSFSGLLLVGGRLADRHGHRKVFLAGLATFAVASAVAGLAQGFVPLVAARFAQGIGAAFAAPAAMALLGAVYPDPVERERKIAVWGSVASIGATAGTLLSGVVVGFTSWRWVFAALVVVAVGALAAAPKLLPTTEPAQGTKLDLTGAALVTLGLTALSYGLVGSVDHGWSAPIVVAPLVLGAALMVAFVVVEAKHETPLVPLRFFGSGTRTAALMSVLLGSAAMSSIFFFLALYFQQVREWSPLQTSAAFLPFSAVLLITGANGGRVVGRFGPGKTAAAGLALSAIGLLLLGTIDAHSPYVGLMALGLLVFPAGAALTFSGATVAAVRDVPGKDAGLAAGVVNTALEIGPTVGLALLVSLAGTVHTGPSDGYALAFTAAGVSAVLAAIAVLVVTGRRKNLEVTTQPIGETQS